MFNAIRRSLAPPSFDDENQTRVAGLLNTILLTLIILLPVIIIGGLIGGNFPPVIYYIVGGTWGVNVGLWLLMRRGQLKLVGSVLLLIILVAVTAAIYFGGTIRIPGLGFYVLAILIAGLTLGRRIAAGTAFLSVAIVFGLFLAEIRGQLPEPAPTTIAQWITFSVVCALTTVLLNLSSRSIEESLERAHRDEREIRTLNATLEQRVIARTRDLTIAAEVGQRVAQVRDLDTLLVEAVELIRARFDLYYTQIYLTETNDRALRMRAGTGRVGQELQRRGLRLPFGVGSLNGTAAAERRAVIVGDTAVAFNFRANPLLPDTRSEMCVPLVSGDRVVGVLDLQSARPGAFSEENLPVFETLAGQLSVALQNAESFAAAEKARAEIEQQARRSARTSWREFLNAVNRQEQFGYTYADAALTVLSTTPLNVPDRPVLTTPLLVAGEPVGELRLEGEADSVWTASEQELVNTVAHQAAQQLENLRLLAQAEDYQRQAEEALRRLTREGWEEHSSARPGYQYELNQEIVALTEATPEAMALTQPLTVRGEAIGELTLAGVATADDETAELVSAVADKLAAHIENLRLFDQTQTALHEAETLFAVTSHLSNATTLREIAETIALVGLDTRLAGVTIRLYSLDQNGEPEWQELAAHWARDPGAADSNIVLRSRSRIADFPFAQFLARATAVILCDDILTDARVDEASRASLSDFGARAAAFLPLTSGTQRLGYVRLIWETPRTFTPAEARLYEAAARNASVSVSNRLLFEQTQKRADREAIINFINQKIQSATSVEGALQIAAREIGQRLKARQAIVEIGTDSNGQH